MLVSRAAIAAMRARAAGFAATALLIALGALLTACASEPTDARAAPATAESSPSPAAMKSHFTFPVADPGGKVDAASQHKADGWLAGAVVPPGATSSRTQPAGVASGASPGMWCKPMAHAVGYWTLPRMSADDTLSWLRSHASQGMMIASASGNPRSGNETNVGGTVVDEPARMSLEAMIFTVTPIGSGSGLRADAFAQATNSVCATPPPGTMLGIGG